MNIIIALLIFSLIIIIHELGHFLLARKNDVFVTEFSLGMGPRIASFVPTGQGYRFKAFLSQQDIDANPEWQENTIYSIKILPLGGSCMMLGEDEIMEDDKAFNKKGVWARISVIFAGPVFNFILAFILAIVVITMIGYDPATISDVSINSPAYEAGIREGDVIKEINGSNISISREVAAYLTFYPLSGEPVDIVYEQNGQKHETTLVPEYRETYSLGFYYAPIDNPAEISSIIENYPMYNAGIQVGDIIVRINDVDIENGRALAQYLDDNPLSKENIELTYIRDGNEVTVNLEPVLSGAGYTLGIGMNYARIKGNIFDTIKYSFYELKYYIATTITSIGQLITGGIGADEIAGPVGIVNIIGDTYQESKSDGALYVFLNLANLCILLSANLGIMNLLPIPALDGGRLVFLIIEAVRGKPIAREKEGMVHFIGLIALMILMVFVLFNDISRLF